MKRFILFAITAFCALTLCVLLKSMIGSTSQVTPAGIHQPSALAVAVATPSSREALNVMLPEALIQVGNRQPKIEGLVFPPATDVAGTKLIVTPVGEMPVDSVGRVGRLSEENLPDISKAAKGQIVKFPLFDRIVQGSVNLVKKNSNGWSRMGGKLDGGEGTFYLASNGSSMNGFINFPAEKLSFEIKHHAPGALLMRERPMSSLLCMGIPRPSSAAVPPPVTEGPQKAQPIFNSRPSAVATLYLDYDGEVVQDPAWDGGQLINAQPAGMDDLEIQESWERVAEDYRVFDINVTTDLARYNAAPVGLRMRAIVTPTDDAGPGTGGVAYLNSFTTAGLFFTDDIPCWVFALGAKNSAEAGSHEFGHTFGLLHDGLTDGTVYYAGHGAGDTSWAPIMGVGYTRNVVTWSAGEYRVVRPPPGTPALPAGTFVGNQRQDDLAIIASNGFDYLPDIVGDNSAGSKPLTILNDTIVDTTGIIERRTDVDVYYFTVDDGQMLLNINSFIPGPNVDLSVELRTQDGILIQSYPSTNTLDIVIDRFVTVGTYELRIEGVGEPHPPVPNAPLPVIGYTDYSSIGQYSITGTLPPGTGAFPRATDRDAIWRTGGDSQWRVQTTITHDGVDAANSGPMLPSPTNISKKNESWIETPVTGPAQVSFWWKVDSENTFDTLEFLIDGIRNGVLTGSVDWVQKTVQFGAGNHVLRWRYVKDSSVVPNLSMDRGWLDEVVVSPIFPPVITNGPSAVGRNDQPFTFQITADNLPSSFNAIGLPSGLRVDPFTGAITGSTLAVGQFPVVISASNPAGTGQATVIFDISGGAPVFVSPATASGQANVPFQYLSQVVNTADSFASSVLPDGLVFNTTTGAITGSPTVWGTFPVTITADNDEGQGTLVLSLVIAPPTPVITSGDGASGIVGQLINYQITATQNPDTFGAINLPPGLTINATGLISGIPTAVGFVSSEVSASNVGGTGRKNVGFSIGAQRSGGDLFANATTLAGSSVILRSSNLGATSEDGENNGGVGGASLWWKWVATQSGEVLVETAGSTFAASVNVYEGDTLAALSAKQNIDRKKTALDGVYRFIATKGVEYKIAVDTVTGAQGAIQLTIRYSAPGVYAGVVVSNTGNRPAGFVSLTLTSTFTFTGTATFNNKRTSIRGTLNDGIEIVPVTPSAPNEPALNLVIRADFSSGSSIITGTVVDKGETYQMTAVRSSTALDLPVGAIAKFNALIEGVAGGGVPSGTGFAVFTVANTGTVKITGTLGDGKKFSHAAPVALNSTIPFFAGPYKNGGSISGTLTLTDNSGVFSLAGPLAWIRIVDSREKLFPGGFKGTANLVGAPYVKPLSGSLPDGFPSNVLIDFTGGDLVPAPADVTGTLSTNGSVTTSNPSTTLRFSFASGTFTGSYRDVDRKTFPISGLILPSSGRAAGFLQGVAATADVDIAAPAPVIP